MTELDPAVYDVLVDQLRGEDDTRARTAAGDDRPAADDDEDDPFGPLE